MSGSVKDGFNSLKNDSSFFLKSGVSDEYVNQNALLYIVLVLHVMLIYLTPLYKFVKMYGTLDERK